MVRSWTKDASFFFNFLVPVEPYPLAPLFLCTNNTSAARWPAPHPHSPARMWEAKASLWQSKGGVGIPGPQGKACGQGESPASGRWTQVPRGWRKAEGRRLQREPHPTPVPLPNAPGRSQGGCPNPVRRPGGPRAPRF